MSPRLGIDSIFLVASNHLKTQKASNLTSWLEERSLSIKVVEIGLVSAVDSRRLTNWKSSDSRSGQFGVKLAPAWHLEGFSNFGWQVKEDSELIISLEFSSRLDEHEQTQANTPELRPAGSIEWIFLPDANFVTQRQASNSITTFDLAKAEASQRKLWFKQKSQLTRGKTNPRVEVSWGGAKVGKEFSVSILEDLYASSWFGG